MKNLEQHLHTNRREFGLGLGLLAAAGGVLGESGVAARQERPDKLVIDLAGDLESIHPSLAYSGRDWSIVNSLYDSIVMIDRDGQVVPLAAESFSTDDGVTFHTTMRSGLQFHDGSAVTAETLRGSWEFLMNSGSSAADVFTVIKDVSVTGDLTADIVCSAPSLWLPAQIATWLMLVPEGYTDEMALNAPVGTGPYRFESYMPGESVDLVRNPDYAMGDVKGEALAESVSFRIVPDAATRVADVSSGTANIVVAIPTDFREEVKSHGSTVVDDPIVGSQWIRIATDVPPFDDLQVRQALAHAIDVDTIASALLAPGTTPLATIFPDERAPGFDSALEPYAYDPEKARSLLKSAGIEEGLEVTLEMTSASRTDVAQAMVANLGEVGIDMSIEATDITTFNEGWTDPERPVLRLVTWSPLFEPHSLLQLVFTSEGYLSRCANPDLDALIAEASVEADPDARRQLLQDVASVMYSDLPVLALWNLTASYGLDDVGSVWKPSGNEQVVPTGPS